jgi:hypothetical protein
MFIELVELVVLRGWDSQFLLWQPARKRSGSMASGVPAEAEIAMTLIAAAFGKMRCRYVV